MIINNDLSESNWVYFDLAIGFSQILAVVCNPNPCFNGGACIPAADGISFDCQCLQSFSGDLCEIGMQ